MVSIYTRLLDQGVDGRPQPPYINSRGIQVKSPVHITPPRAAYSSNHHHARACITQSPADHAAAAAYAHAKPCRSRLCCCIRSTYMPAAPCCYVAVVSILAATTASLARRAREPRHLRRELRQLMLMAAQAYGEIVLLFLN